MLLFGADETVGGVLAEHVPEFAGTTEYRAIGALNQLGELVGGVAYSNFRDFDLEMTCWGKAGTNWLTPGNLAGWYAFPFRQLELVRVTALVREDNIISRRLMKRLGYKQEGVVRKGFGDQNCIVYGLLREEWAALPHFHNYHKTKTFLMNDNNEGIVLH